MFTKLRINSNHLLIIGTVVLLLVSYKLALKKTLEAWQLNKKLQTEVSAIALNEQPAYLERQNKSLTTVINSYKSDTVNYRNTIVTIISEAGRKRHVRVVEVPTQTNLSTKQYMVQKLTLKGDFFDLLKTLNSLQLIEGLGYIRAVSIKKNTDSNQLKTDKELDLQLFIETIK